MESLIGVMNRIQRACTRLGDFGGADEGGTSSLPMHWDALPTIVVLGGQVKKANPEAEFKEISNLLGAKWKTITPEEKKPYEEKYQAEKEAYLKVVGNEKREHEAMRLLEEEQKHKTAIDLYDQYVQYLQEAEKENTKKNKKEKDPLRNKKEKDPLKPKQPMSAFFVYSSAPPSSIRR